MVPAFPVPRYRWHPPGNTQSTGLHIGIKTSQAQGTIVPGGSAKDMQCEIR